MNIIHCRDYGKMSRLAASLVLDALEEKPDLLLCAATGSSPKGLYDELAQVAATEKERFSQLRIFKLDEWGGIPENHPVSCEYFLRSRLLNPLDIPENRYISFNSSPEDPEVECKRIRTRLMKEGPLDICILGLGKNGHLGLNEPAPELKSFCHVATLSQESLQHPMIEGLVQKPSYGFTLGIKEILDSRKVIMLVSGPGKKKIAADFLEGNVSTHLPASLLWQHPEVECLVEQSVLD